MAINFGGHMYTKSILFGVLWLTFSTHSFGAQKEPGVDLQLDSATTIVRLLDDNSVRNYVGLDSSASDRYQAIVMEYIDFVPDLKDWNVTESNQTIIKDLNQRIKNQADACSIFFLDNLTPAQQRKLINCYLHSEGLIGLLHPLVSDWMKIDRDTSSKIREAATEFIEERRKSIGGELRPLDPDNTELDFGDTEQPRLPKFTSSPLNKVVLSQLPPGIVHELKTLLESPPRSVSRYSQLSVEIPDYLQTKSN